MAEKLIIATDSACDLSPELVKKYNIKVLPLHVNIDSEEYSDGIDIDIHKLFEKVEETGKAPKTAAASPKEFVEFFEKILEEDSETHVIYLGIGSSLSGTFQSAHIAKQIIDSDRLHLVDSKNLSTGIGLVILKAIEYNNRGWTIEKTISKLEKLVSRVKVQFVIKTLEYLKKGGRCKGVAFIIGSLLKIRPMISVQEGKLIVTRKTIGPMKKACAELLKVLKKDVEKVDYKYAFITHCNAVESVEYVKQEVENLNIFENLYVTNAGCTIGSHCGPGTIGLLYVLKNEDVTLEEEDI